MALFVFQWLHVFVFKYVYSISRSYFYFIVRYNLKAADKI